MAVTGSGVEHYWQDARAFVPSCGCVSMKAGAARFSERGYALTLIVVPVLGLVPLLALGLTGVAVASGVRPP